MEAGCGRGSQPAIPYTLSRLLDRVVVMKSSQWIGALLVLGIMVFVITFAMNFLNTGKSQETATTKPELVPGGHNLTFYTMALPPDPDPRLAIYHEDKHEGSLDFLFENTNEEDVKIGLIRKNCRCTSVKLVLVTADWKARRAALWAAETVAERSFHDLIGPQMFAELSRRILRPDQDKELQKIQQDIRPAANLLDQSEREAVGVVPAKALAFIRLGWDNTKTGLERFNVDLWIGGTNTGMNAQLAAEVHFVKPLQADITDLKVNELNETELEKKPFEGSFVVGSSIRPALKLRTEVVHLPRFGDRFDPFVAGQPVPLTGDELTAFKYDPANSGALCAYRVPVKLYGRSPDGKVAIDLGGFRRRLKLWSDDDKGVEPIELTVTGSVQGSVLIGDRQDDGRLTLGVFDSSAGSARQTLSLTGKTAGLQLEVDKERTPEFLREGARLEKLADVAGLPRWKLYVQVKPNAAQGSFPRLGDPMYYDSAVYLKVKGEVVQNVRVPVDGTANAQE
jgi:hypothetical protein